MHQKVDLKSLLISILTFGRVPNVVRLLNSMVHGLDEFAARSNLAVTIVIRNNDPTADVFELEQVVDAVCISHVGFDVEVISGHPNTGFGRGHNENLRTHPSDLILILNDDIGFGEMSWLTTAFAMFQADPALVLIGEDSNPQYLNPTFGNGVFPSANRQFPLKYAEASVLFGRASILKQIGMFDESFAWAMCEDADLSLTFQSLGYRIAWLRMPHEHWRSTSFNSLPGQVKSSIMEHNRARLFAKWSESLKSGRVGRYTVIDLGSDGIGDVFCSLPHLLADLTRQSRELQSQVVVNTNHAELVRALLPETVEVVSYPSIEELVKVREPHGINSIRSIRNLNYSSPVNLHALLAGALSLPFANEDAMEAFRGRLRDLGRTVSSVAPEQPYCVFHSEFVRDGHEGRAMSRSLALEVLQVAAKRYEKVVVVGRERQRLVSDRDGLPGNVVELQGQLSVFELIDLIGHATAFVGLDSFPAHIAQALQVPAIVFFGSVHPNARLWAGSPVWPLVADLDCIGCYNLQLEPSIPFCMRRDRACERQVSSERIEEAFNNLPQHSIATAAQILSRWHELQARHTELQVFHPNAAIANARPKRFGNETLSNLISDITEQVASLYESQRSSGVVRRLEQTVAALKERVAAREATLEDIFRRPAAISGQRRSITMPLSDRVQSTIKCEAVPDDGWLEVDCFDEDPQIFFAPVEVAAGLISIRLETISEQTDSLQIFWAEREGDFEATRLETFPIGPRRDVHVFRLSKEVAGKLWIRADPLTSRGHVRLRLTATGRQLATVA